MKDVRVAINPALLKQTQAFFGRDFFERSNLEKMLEYKLEDSMMHALNKVARSFSLWDIVLCLVQIIVEHFGLSNAWVKANRFNCSLRNEVQRWLEERVKECPDKLTMGEMPGVHKYREQKVRVPQDEGWQEDLETEDSEAWNPDELNMVWLAGGEISSDLYCT